VQQYPELSALGTAHRYTQRLQLKPMDVHASTLPIGL